ncbi:MAG: hypothetical protein D6744_05595 [Planctomycetota bacterium]|nr:MAG: hypothetical protein D6744_05595 [Planctomycetota bacterium]
MISAMRIGRHPRRAARGVLLVIAAVTALPVLASAQSSASVEAVVIPVQGEITDILWRGIERRVERAREDGVRTIIFELNTPGGLVTSALGICRLIKNLPEEIHTVAWVNSDAYSAGAMIALACDEIVMSRSSAIGDCAPILMGPIGGADQEISDRLAAKVESPILQEFRDSAQRNGYDLLLARAMVKWEQEVWWIENVATGERRFVGGEEKKQLIDEAPDDGEPQWRLVTSFVDPVTQREHELTQPIDRDDQLLTLSQGEAVAFGFASAIVSDLSELKQYLGLSSEPPVLETSGWEHFAVWLNSNLVRGILFVIMIIGAYIEFHSPGLIVPGVTAVIALVIFLAAPYAAGLADVWTLVLFGLGVLLLAVEVFLIPGFGIAGLLGLSLIVISFIGTFVPTEPGAPPFSWPTLPGTWDAIKTGIIVMASSTIIAVIGIGLLARYLPYAPLASKLVLPNPEQNEVVSVGDASPDAAFVGDVGVVTGALRPGGQARFGQRIVDVTSQGEYVEAGTRVQVIEHDGMRIVVRPLKDEPNA